MNGRPHFPDKLRNTPCSRCGHGHAGSDGHDGLERCGEWLSAWSWDMAEFYICECPEWSQPPYRCSCGLTSLTPFPSWLGGIRAHAIDCARAA